MNINELVELHEIAHKFMDERERQIEIEGFTFEHDDSYTYDQLGMAASVYAKPDRMRYAINKAVAYLPDGWPWLPKWFKPTPEDRERELVKAGALIIAEIQRLRRINKQK